MNKNTIVLNESELQNIIAECVQEAINEGFFDRFKAGWQGAKQGYSGQKMLDRGTDDFKQQWGRDELKQLSNPWSSHPENTAEMQANDAYKKYKYYKNESDKYLALYNKLTNKYNLQKKGVGKRVSSEKSNLSGTGGIIDNMRNKERSGKFGGTYKQRGQEAIKQRGLWG